MTFDSGVLCAAMTVVTACGLGDAAARCVPGMQVECACPGQVGGIQVCLESGTFGSCTCAAAAPAESPPAPAAPTAAPASPAVAAAAQPSGAAPVRDRDALMARVRELRAESWNHAPIIGAPAELFAHLNLSGDGQRRDGDFSWRPPNGPEVRLFGRATEHEIDTGEPQLDGFGLELRVQLRAVYTGSDAGGSLLVRERRQLPASARSERVDLYLRVAQRTDGAVLAAFDSHGLDFDTDHAVPAPEHSRRLLLVWDPDFSQPIAVADWTGDPLNMPAWARF